MTHVSGNSSLQEILLVIFYSSQTIYKIDFLSTSNIPEVADLCIKFQLIKYSIPFDSHTHEQKHKRTLRICS